MQSENLIDKQTSAHVGGWALFYLAYLGILIPPDAFQGFSIPANEGYLHLPLMAVVLALIANSINTFEKRRGKFSEKFKKNLKTNSLLVEKQQRELSKILGKDTSLKEASLKITKNPRIECGRFTKPGGGLTDPITIKLGISDLILPISSSGIKTIVSNDKKPIIIYITSIHATYLSGDGLINFIASIKAV